MNPPRKPFCLNPGPSKKQALLGFLMTLLAGWTMGRAALVPGYFRQLDFECGGYISGFAAHPAGRLYARANVGGVYRSNDHGETWTWLSGDLPYPACHLPWGLAVAPGNPDLLYQSTGTSYTATNDPGQGIWKSIDGGAHWRQVLSGVRMAGNDEAQYGGPALLLHPANENEIWAATRGDGVRRSTDAGEHWTRVGGATFDGFVPCGLCIHPGFPDQVWVAGEGGVYVSVDHGATWTRLRQCTRAARVERFRDGTVLIAGLDKGRAFLWAVTSRTWDDPASYVITDRSASFAEVFSSLALLKILRDDQTVIAGGNLVTKRSRDRGVTWETLPMNQDESGSPILWHHARDTKVGWGRSELLQDPLDAGRWYINGGNNPGVSTNGGVTWRNLSRGLGEMVCQKAVFHPTRPDLVFIPVADQTCLIITDGGRSGTASTCLYKLLSTPVTSWAVRLLVQGDRAIALYNRWDAAGARLAVATGDYTQWKEIKPKGIPLDAFCDGAMAIDRADELLVLAGGTTGPGQGGIYRSTNGGQTFVQSKGLPSGLFVGGKFSYFGNCGVQADPTEPDIRYYLMPQGGFLRSEDRGVTWHEPCPGFPRSAGALTLDPRRAGRLWAAVLTPGTGSGLLRSDDRGTTWKPIGDFEFTAPRIDALGGRIVVFGKRPGDTWNKIYYSADDGSTWGEITRKDYRFPTTEGLALDPYRDNQIWISTSGRSAAIFTLTTGP